MKLLKLLWSNGISARMCSNNGRKLLNQFQECEKDEIPIALIVAQREIDGGYVMMRDTKRREEVQVDVGTLVKEIKLKLGQIETRSN